MASFYENVRNKVPQEELTVAAAVDFLRENSRKSFDETIELHIHLGVDPGKSDLLVRGSVELPAGSPKQQKIVVFAEDQATRDAAKKAGAAHVGGEELITEIIQNKTLDADLTIATPSMMPKIAKAAKILGPKGLMPNPKMGTVSDDPAQVVSDLRGGKFQFKMDSLGNIHLSVGKASWKTEQLVENINACVSAVLSAKPASARGEFIQSCTLASTMSPGISIKK